MQNYVWWWLKVNDYITPGIPDSMFIRGKVPITKEEVRTIALSKLRLTEKSRILDIGAGTGSVTVECARTAHRGFVHSVEKNPEALSLIKQNLDKFNITNADITGGYAPDVLDDSWNFDRAFIGGSGGNLTDVLRWVEEHITGNGNIVVTSITMNTLTLAWNYFKDNNYDYEIIQASISRCEEAGSFTMFKAQNPVFIISAKKKQ